MAYSVANESNFKIEIRLLKDGGHSSARRIDHPSAEPELSHRFKTRFSIFTSEVTGGLNHPAIDNTTPAMERS